MQYMNLLHTAALDYIQPSLAMITISLVYDTTYKK